MRQHPILYRDQRDAEVPDLHERIMQLRLVSHLACQRRRAVVLLRQSEIPEPSCPVLAREVSALRS